MFIIRTPAPLDTGSTHYAYEGAHHAYAGAQHAYAGAQHAYAGAQHANAAAQHAYAGATLIPRDRDSEITWPLPVLRDQIVPEGPGAAQPLGAA